MSLLDEAMETCVIIDKVTVPDGMGGSTRSWQEGATIKCAITFDTSITARIADKQGVTSRYTVTTNKNTRLDFHDVIKRLSDNKVFRITSDGDDVFTPQSASLNMRQVTAEEWVIPNE